MLKLAPFEPAPAGQIPVYTKKVHSTGLSRHSLQCNDLRRNKTTPYQPKEAIFLGQTGVCGAQRCVRCVLTGTHLAVRMAVFIGRERHHISSTYNLRADPGA